MRQSAFLLLLSSNAFAGTIYTVNTSNYHLMAFDTRALTFTDVGDLGFPFDFGDIAVDSGGRMYIVGGRSDSNLRVVNLPSATTTVIGSHGIPDLFGLAWDPTTSSLWGFSASTYLSYKLNTSTGTPTQYGGTLPFYAGGCYYSAPHAGIVCDNAGGGEWYSFNTTTYTSTLVAASTGYLNNNGTAYDPDTNLVFTFDWSQIVASYDPVTLTRITEFNSGFPMDGAGVFGGSSGPSIALGGSCPSAVTVTGSGFTPSGNVAIVKSNGPGSFAIPSGACAGTLTGLSASGVSLVTMAHANGSGNINYAGSIGAALCSKTFQFVDMSTCTVSNVDTF